LEYLHKQPEPITHRYLDPNEILITHGLNGKFIKIADFSGKLIHANHQEDVIPRKVYRYIAPEIMDYLDDEISTRAKKYDTKADIYSLGKIVCEMFHYYIAKYIATNDK
jgi:serine/threonine protein kinase